MNIDFPYNIDGRGRTASTDDDDHIRDMIEQLLFAPNSPELAAALQFTMQAALQRYLGDLIDLKSLAVTVQDSTLSVVVQYLVRQTQESQTQTFQRSGVQ